MSRHFSPTPRCSWPGANGADAAEPCPAVDRLGSLMPTISVVIRTFNEERHIGRLLVGLKRQSVKPDEIVLVDSGSTDATRFIARPHVSKLVEISPAEFSFGRALNR